MKKNIFFLTFFFISLTIVNSKAQNSGDVVFAGLQVFDIKIYFSQPNYWDSLTTYYNQGNEQYMMARIEIDGLVFDSIGVRLKGNSSYSHPNNKKPFRISFDEYIDDRRWDDLKGIHLNNCWRDPSFMREKMHLDFLRDAGINAPRANYARVYLNDQLWGFYSLVEHVDKRFLRTRYGNTTGNLYKAIDGFGTSLRSDFIWYGPNPSSYHSRYELKTEESLNPFEDLVVMIDSLNNNPNTLTALPSVFNVNTYYRALAADILFANLDSYINGGRNFYFYNNPPTGKFEWIVWDVSLSMGGYSVSTGAENLSVTYVSNPTTRPLVGKIYNTPILRANYLQALCLLYNEYFSVSRLHPKVDSIANTIRPYVQADPRKMYTNAQFETNINSDIGSGGSRIPGIKSFITARQTSVQNQLNNLNVSCDNPLTPFVNWNFEENPLPGGDSNPLPSLGLGTASIVGSMSNPSRGAGTSNGCTQTSGTGSWHFGTANPGTTENSSGAQFMVSTAGYGNIVFEYDHRFSGTSTRTVRIQYTTNNGIEWINYHVTPTDYSNFCSDRGGIDDGKIDVTDPVGINVSDSWSRRTIDFSNIPGVENNPEFGVRVVAAHFQSTGEFRQSNNVNNQATAGTWRFDNVTFYGTFLTNIIQNEIVTSNFELHQNFPNPFNPETTIKFRIPFDNFVTLKVFDITGKEVMTLANGFKTAGTHSIVFNASEFASGVYFYKLEVGDYSQVRRMLMIK